MYDFGAAAPGGHQGLRKEGALPGSKLFLRSTSKGITKEPIIKTRHLGIFFVLSQSLQYWAQWTGAGKKRCLETPEDLN